MFAPADSSDAPQHRHFLPPKILRLGALGVTVFGLIENPLARLLLLIAAAMLALQALVLVLCTGILRRAVAVERGASREKCVLSWPDQAMSGVDTDY